MTYDPRYQTSRPRDPAYYRSTLKRTLARYNDGKCGPEALASEVARFLGNTR